MDEKGRALGRAQAFLDLGRGDDALLVLAPLLAGNPHDRDLLSLNAVALLTAGRNAEAVTAASDAIQADPTNEQAFRVSALALSREGRTAEARDSAERAVELQPGVWQTHYVLAAVDASDRTTLWRAREAIDRAAALAPEHSEVLNLRGRVLLAQNDHWGAKHVFDTLLAQDPQHLDARIGLASALAALSRDDEASAVLLGHLRDDPQSAVARHNLGAPFRNILLHLTTVGLLVSILALVVRPPTPALVVGLFGSLAVGLWTAISNYRKSARIAMGAGGYLRLMTPLPRIAAIVTTVALVLILPAVLASFAVEAPWSILLALGPSAVAVAGTVLVVVHARRSIKG